MVFSKLWKTRGRYVGDPSYLTAVSKAAQTLRFRGQGWEEVWKVIKSIT